MFNRTPDEIKQGLMCLVGGEELDGTCGGCAYLDTRGPCVDHVLPDVLALVEQLQADNAGQAKTIMWMEAERDDLKRYIQQLEAQNAELSGKIGQLQAERDAVMRDMTKNCASCKYAGFNNPGSDGCPYVEQCQNYRKWQWRGIPKEDGNEST